jgi:hypothetical protein
VQDSSAKPKRPTKKYRAPQPSEKKPPLPESSTLNLRKPLTERSNRPLSNLLQTRTAVSFDDAGVGADKKEARRSVYFADAGADVMTSSADLMTSSADTSSSLDATSLSSRRSLSCERDVPRKSRKDIFLFWKSKKPASPKSKQSFLTNQ